MTMDKGAHYAIAKDYARKKGDWLRSAEGRLYLSPFFRTTVKARQRKLPDLTYNHNNPQQTI